MSTTALVLRDDVLRVQIELLLLAAQHATPGPWEVGDGCVVVPSIPPSGSRFRSSDGQGDNDTWRYYGGDLVCETIATRDALLVCAARNLVPQICQLWIEERRRARDAERWLEFYRSQALRLERLNTDLRVRNARARNALHNVAGEFAGAGVDA